MTTSEQYRALKLMQEIGGGFASALATAWLKADHANSQRLEWAFGDLLEQYGEMCRMVAAGTPSKEPS
jgi:hypothetical protein